MNLLKLMAKKVMLIVSIIILWILDDAAFFLPDSIVWSLMGFILGTFGYADRVNGLKAYWIGGKAK